METPRGCGQGGTPLTPLCTRRGREPGDGRCPVHIHQKNEGPGLPLGPSFLILKAVPSTLPGYIYWVTDFLTGLYPFWL